MLLFTKRVQSIGTRSPGLTTIFADAIQSSLAVRHQVCGTV